jgi:ABC-type iron transport system FetAB ATPase subunit
VNFPTSRRGSLSHARVALGRTGSGKSTLTLAFLLAIITKGSVYHDGVKTSTVSLEELRPTDTVIPQVVRHPHSTDVNTQDLTQPELLNDQLLHPQCIWQAPQCRFERCPTRGGPVRLAQHYFAAIS